MRTTFKKIVPLALFILGFALLPKPALADSITLSPPKFELLGNPGDVITEKIKVSNSSDTDVEYKVSAEDFTAADDQGSVTFIDPTVSKDSFSLARWITFEPSDFTVPAGQEKVISYTIHIPTTGEPGGHYGSIIITRPGVSQAGAAAVSSQVSSLILLRVSGAITEKLSLESFLPENGFQQYGPINFNMRYKNEGNVHVAPSGTIVITNIFGKKVKEIPVSGSNVLPDAERVIKASWDDKNLVGRYTASLVVNYGQSKQSIAASTTFFVFPLYLLVVILVLILLIYLLITKRKSFKRLINNLTRE